MKRTTLVLCSVLALLLVLASSILLSPGVSAQVGQPSQDLLFSRETDPGPGPLAPFQTASAWISRTSMPTARFALGVAAANNGKLYAIGGEGSNMAPVATVEEYDPTNDTWVTRTSMPTARRSLGVAKASNGKIYAIGGANSANPLGLATVEEYDPASGTWATRASMPTARYGMGLVAAGNGKLYAIGGYVSEGSAVVEAYDPATDTWAARASMPTARQFLGAAAASNGKIYAIGGVYAGGMTPYATVEEYDPETDTWATRASMPTARGGVGVAVASDGNVYVIGGDIAYASRVSTVEALTFAGSGATATPTPTPTLGPTPLPLGWTSRASMPTARFNLGVAAASNGKLYAVGGYTYYGGGQLSAVEEYSPTTDAWVTRASLPGARYLLGVAAASNGKVYAIGGYNGSYLSTVEEYNPAANTWATRASMPTARYGLGVVAASNGKIYAIGGYNGTDLSTVEEYDPATNIWTARASMPTARQSLGVAAASNGKVYAVGGHSGGIGRPTVEEYDPATDTWTTRASMPTGRWDLGVATATNGKIYAIGGMYCSTCSSVSTVEEYDPATDTWATVASMPTARGYLGAAAASDGRVYAIGGSQNMSSLSTVEALTVGGSGATPSPTPTGVVTGTVTSTPTRTATPTPSSTPTATPTAAPAAPIELRADPGFDRIQLGWTPSGNPALTQYRVWRATPNAQAVFAAIGTTGDTSYYDMAGALANGVNYCYKVEALAGAVSLQTSDAACAVFGQLDLWVPEIYSGAGETIIVPVNIRNATGLSIVSADFWLDFDPSVAECTSVSNTAMTTDFYWDSNRNNSTGRVKISTFASPPKTIYGDGSLFWLAFHITGTAGISSPLNLLEFGAGGGSSLQTLGAGDILTEVPLSLTDGTIYVETTGLLGDVDNNGVVAAADAYLTLQISVGKIVPNWKQRYAADVNGDGQITSADVSMILHYAVSGSWPLPPPVMAAVAAATSAVTTVGLDDVIGAPGAVVTTVLWANNLQGWAGGDWTITYDRNVVGSVTGVVATGIGGGSPLAFFDNGQGRVKISVSRSAAVSGSGAVAILSLRMAANPSNQTTALNLANVGLNDAYGRDFVRSAIQGRIERQNGELTVTRKVFLPLIVKQAGASVR